MFIPTAVALAAAFWTIALVALAVEKHVFDQVLRLWKSLSKFNKCVVTAILVGVVAFAGTKPLSGGGDDGGDDSTGTNIVEIVEGDATNLVENGEAQSGEGEDWDSQSGEAVSRPLLMEFTPPYTSGQESASPLSASSFSASSSAPLSLDAVGRGEPLDFSAPEGAVVATNWLMHGATTGRVRVSPPDWDFPFGTNILRSFAAFADGRLEPWPGGSGITLAPLVASLGIVPEPNWALLAPTNRPSLFWWTMRDNALVCTWQNVLLGREIDCPVSFQAELRATGGVTYRYDLGRLASDDPLTNAAVFATDSSVPLCLRVKKSLTSLAFRSTEEVACDECAASLASAMGGADPFACPPNSTNTVLEHAYYTGTTNGAIHLPESSPALAVLRVSVGGTGSGELLVGDRAVPLRAPPTSLVPHPSSLLLSVPRGETLPVYLRGDSTLSLSLDSDDFAFGVLPDLSGRHCRGWINFPYTEASHPCIHGLMAHETDVTLPVGEGADDLTCAWNETDDVEVRNLPPRSARITGHFDPRCERPVTYTLSHPRYLFGQTEYEQNARYCPKPSDDDPTDYLGVGVPFPDECWCCHWQTCDTNCTCGCDTCGDWTVSPTNDYDFASTNYPPLRNVLKIRTPREYSASVALSVPTGVRRCCPCPEHWTNGVSLVYARRVSVVDPSGSEFRSSGEPVTVRVAATEPSYDPGDGSALFATNGVPMTPHNYTCLGVSFSHSTADLVDLNRRKRSFGFPFVICTNIYDAAEIRLNVDVLLRGGRITLGVENANAPIEVWGYDCVHGDYIKLADAENTLDLSMAEWRRLTGNANGSGVPSTTVFLLSSSPGDATLVLRYWNVIDNKFVEDEARQVVTAVNPPLLPDYNRDGAINAQDVLNWLGGAIFRYWTNQDAENGDCVDEISDDVANASDLVVNGHLDLVNLFPLALNLKPFVNAWGTAASFELWTRQSSEPLHVCLADIPWNEAGKIQTEDVRTVDDALVATSGLKTVFYDGYTVSNSTVRDFSANSGLLIAEAASPINDSIRLTVRLGGDVVMEHKIPVRIRSVREMYRFYSLRGAASNGDNNFVPPSNPGAYTHPDEKDQDIFFTHGFNVTESEAHLWGDALFKRFWLSGSNARFNMVTWEGNYNLLGNGFNGLHYQHDVWYALRTAGALKRLLEREQPNPTNRVLMTQSLGNMVACEALRQGLHVGRFFMFDAALPSEAIDGTLQAKLRTDPAFPKYVRCEWTEYPYRSWASHWSGWFRDNPTDARGRMGWPGRFADALGNANVVYNYYSSGDPVFTESQTVPSMFSGVFHWPTLSWQFPFVNIDFTFDVHCWQKQEVLKGMAALAGTMSGGWGFGINTRIDENDPYGPVEWWKYSPEQAAAKVADGSITNNPVFNTVDALELLNPNATDDDVWLALAKHVPAVSSPVGGNKVLDSSDDFDIDMNQERFVPRPNAWGRPEGNVYDQNWLHSDMKDMAYYYVFNLYEQLVTKGELK